MAELGLGLPLTVDDSNGSVLMCPAHVAVACTVQCLPCNTAPLPCAPCLC